MQTIKPGRGYIFAKPADEVKQTASGFFLSEKAAEKPKTATVINVASDVTGYSPDDIIVYKSYATTDVRVNSQEFILVAEEDVIGKVIEVADGQ